MARQLAARQAGRPDVGAAPPAAPGAPPDTAPPATFAGGGKAEKTASGRPFYGERIIPNSPRGEKLSDPNIKDMAPFDQYSAQPVPILDPMEMLLLPTPSKATHQREEPDTSGLYAKGGKVKPFGFANGGSSKFGKDYRK
jgi:hypothetical protein